MYTNIHLIMSACLLFWSGAAASVVIKVDEVREPDEKLVTVELQKIVNDRFGKPEAFSVLDKKVLTYQTVSYDEENGNNPIIFTSRSYPLKETNPFVAAMTLAFANHQKISLSPDMIWLLICQGLSVHINLNPKEYFKYFTRSTKKQRIEVRHDSLKKGVNDPKWMEAVAMFRDSLSTRIDPSVMRIFDKKFSTTTPVEETAFRMSLMDATKSYYEYSVMTVCGVPEITLEGTREDWKSILDATGQLDTFGLNWWTRELKPVLGEFINAYDGMVDTLFWCSIVSAANMSGRGLLVNGWMAKFFPYMLNGKKEYVRNRIMTYDFRQALLQRQSMTPLEKKTSELHQWDDPQRFLSMPCFPNGVLETPFVWKTSRKRYKLMFVSGFIAASYDSGSSTLRPEIGYAIIKKH